MMETTTAKPKQMGMEMRIETMQRPIRMRSKGRLKK